MALLPGNALPLLRRDLDEPRQVQRPDLPAQIVVIGTLQDDSASRLPRGQAMQRVLLTAIRPGLGASSMAISPDLPNGRQQLQKLIGGGLWPSLNDQFGRTRGRSGHPRGRSALPPGQVRVVQWDRRAGSRLDPGHGRAKT